MRTDPMQSESPAARKAWQIILDAAREAYVGDPDPDEERVSWANYGETQKLAEGEEPPPAAGR